MFPEALAADLRSLLGDSGDVSADEAATKDFSWVSPIIHGTIPRTLPDAVVTVRSTEAVRHPNS